MVYPKNESIPCINEVLLDAIFFIEPSCNYV